MVTIRHASSGQEGRAMDAAIGLGVATLVLLAITLIAAVQVRRVRAMVKLTPNQAVRAPGGRVQLAGVTRPVDGVVPAPLSGQPSLMVRVAQVIEDSRQYADGSIHTTERHEEVSRVDTRFAVVDAAPPHHWVLVDSREITAHTLPIERIRQAGGRSLQVGRIGRSTRSPNLRFVEQRLLADQPVWITGELSRFPDGTVQLHRSLSLATREPSTRSTGVVIFAVLTVLAAIGTVIALAAAA